MGKKDYNAGAKMGIKLSEDIVEKNTKTYEYILTQCGKYPEQFLEIKSEVLKLLDNVESMEIEKIYGVVKTEGIDNFEYEEKILLLKLINKVALTIKPNENQQKFSRNLCSYLNINIQDTIYDTYDDVNISIIDSRQVQTTMYQIVKEYLYLANNSHKYSNNYDSILKSFSRDIDNGKIEALINIKVSIFGYECLFEQYGSEILEQEDKTEDMMRACRVKLSLLKVNIGFAKISFKRKTMEILEVPEMKKEVDNGKIHNMQVISYINEIAERSEVDDYNFVSGIKYVNSNNYLIIFVTGGFFVQKDNKIVYIEYSKLISVEENDEGLVICIHSGMICDDNLQAADITQIEIKRDEQNYKYLRSIRKCIEEIVETYDGMLPCVANVVEEIIEQQLKKISKSSPTYMVKDIRLDEKKEKKLRKALAKYAVKVRIDDVIAFIDTSFWGNGSAGLLFAKDGIAFEYAFEKIFAKYEEIEDMLLGKKNKCLVLEGRFSEREDNLTNPEISDIYFNLLELKKCIEKIRYHI